MDPNPRQAEIVKIVRQRVRASVNELAAILNVSKETIRRDLAELDRLGKVEKFHGGAGLPMVKGEGLFQERMAQNVAAKAQIAEAALALIAPGETLLIDTGSTTLYFAEKLVNVPALTVVTNSTRIARIMSKPPSQARTFLLGGEFHADNRQTVGSIAISQVQSFRAHHAILTVGALDNRTGAMDFSIEEAQLARAMVEQAEKVTILIDHSKFTQIASFEVCSLHRITHLVCDQEPPEPLKNSLLEANVTLITPDL